MYTTITQLVEFEGGETDDSDAFHQGIAPSVKLLFAVVAQIAELDRAVAVGFVWRWRAIDSVVHVRLWAAAARDPRLVPAKDVGTFLLGLEDIQFWEVQNFPEIAEVRAVRFAELEPSMQKAITRRIRARPPRSLWRQMDPAERRRARQFWAVREMQRLVAARAQLSTADLAWLKENIAPYPDLAATEVAVKSRKRVFVGSRHLNPDSMFDSLKGFDRLRALEEALGAGRRGWDDDRSERAHDWIIQQGNVELVLDDLEAAKDGIDAFPRVWEQFGWAHKPPKQGEGAPENGARHDAFRVLELLGNLSNQTLSDAIDGVCEWLSNWSAKVISSPLGLRIWTKIWPTAVAATNNASDSVDDADLSVSVLAHDSDHEPKDLDTLNTPVGKLVGVFLAGCPNLETAENAFGVGSPGRKMRDLVIDATDRSGLIVRTRLIEQIPYFLNADADWARKRLIEPLLSEDEASLPLWRGIARQTHYGNVLKYIGDAT